MGVRSLPGIVLCTQLLIAFLAASPTPAQPVDGSANIRFHPLIDINQTRGEYQPDTLSIYDYFHFRDQMFVYYYYWRYPSDTIGGWFVTDGTVEGTTRFYDPALSPPLFPVGEGFCGFVEINDRNSSLLCSDGTTSGTRMVARIPMVLSLEWNWYAAGSVTFLTVEPDYVGGTVIWRTDGTPEGTWMVHELDEDLDITAWDGFAFQGEFFFCPRTWGHRNPTGDLWASDGSPSGTHVIVPYTEGQPGVCTSKGRYRGVEIEVLGDRIIFNCDRSWRRVDFASDLCASTSPTAGFEVISDVGAHSPRVNKEHGYLLFWGHDDSGQLRLWRTDGTPGSVLPLTDGWVGEYSSSPPDSRWRIFAGEDYFFTSRERLEDGGFGPSQLWVVRGGTSPAELIHEKATVRAASDHLAFLWDSPTESTWVTDGTLEGTRLLQENLVVENGAPLGDLLVFAGRESGEWGPLGLWVSDGTTAGTKNLLSLPAANSGSDPRDFADLGDRALFLATDGLSGREPWITDGTPEGTFLLGDTTPGPDDGAINPEDFDLGLLGCSESGLWISDGAPLSLRRLPMALVCAHPPVMLGSKHVVLASQNGVTGLWTSDGTSEGTSLLTTFPGVGLDRVGPVMATLGRVVFEVDDGLWQSDGTVAGTGPVFEGALLSVSRLLGEVGGSLLMIAADAEHGAELWTTDGTVEGTSLVRDINPGAAPGADCSDDTTWAILDSRLWFAGREPERGLEPWVSDGTAGGTFRLGDLGRPNYSADTRDSSPHHFVPVSGRVAFSASAPEPVFVTTDGTPGGTRVEWLAGEGDDLPLSSETTPYQGLLLYWRKFSTPDYIRSGIWASDGTAEGTREIWRTFSTRILSSENGTPVSAVVNGDRLVFGGYEGITNLELWVAEPVGPREPAGRTP